MTLEEGSRSLSDIWRFYAFLIGDLTIYASQLPPGSRRLGLLLESADAFLIRDLEFLRVPHWRFGDLRPQNQPEMRWRYRTSSISGKHPGTPPLGNLVLLLYLRISVPDIM